MPFPLSPHSIDAIAEIITGGVYVNSGPPPIGIYRSGPMIEKFMRGCNIPFKIDGSRVPSLTGKLEELNKDDAEGVLPRIIEAAADARDFMTDPDRHQAVIDYLNKALAYDGLELQRQGPHVRLAESGKSTPVLAHLSEKAEIISFDTVRRDLDRALASAKNDPEDAVTAACSVAESVCRSILIELNAGLPDKKDIQGLYKAVREPLGLDPKRSDIDPSIADDVRKILSGLNTVIEGVGALRTHGGDAHGRERGYARVDSRIAELAINSASTVALFLIETWQKKYPAKKLHFHT